MEAKDILLSRLTYFTIFKLMDIYPSHIHPEFVFFLLLGSIPYGAY